VTHDIETLLTDALREEVARMPEPAPDLLARAMHRHRRRTTARRVVSSAGALGLAASLGIALTITATGNRSPGSGSQGSRGPSASGSSVTPVPNASPKLKLLSALTATDQTSYRIRQTLTGRYLDRHDLSPISNRLTGLLDPVHGLASGELVSGNGWAMELRQVDGVLYSRTIFPKDPALQHWFKDSAGSKGLIAFKQGGVPSEWFPWTGTSPGATRLITMLRAQGSVTLAGSTGSGPDVLDSYRFSYNRPDDGAFAAEQVTGTVVVHRDSNLIARIDVGTTTTGHIEQVTIRWRFTVEFSDFGVPVTVTAPADALQRGQSARKTPPPTSAS
jgi:hypothetical protein